MNKDKFVSLIDTRDYEMISTFKEDFIDLLKQYYFVGGMPEAVNTFVEERNFNLVRQIQKRILLAYEQDFF